MASLVPIKFSELTAKYQGLNGKLLLNAKGKIPGFFLKPFFDQEIWVGALKFAVLAYSGGLSKLPHEKEVEFDFELPIHLPIHDFNNETVLIKTAFGISEIKIEYLDWAKPTTDLTASLLAAVDDITLASNPDKKSGYNTIIRPPKHFYLSDTGNLEITAEVPKQPNASVNIDFNPNFIRLVSSSYEKGFIKWTIAWENVPDLAHDPQRVSVITTIPPEVKIQIWPPIPDPKDIQPYLIHRLFMLSDQKE
ncbi:hypothetical protein FVEG_13664 [Fusarium verticillioides 7600]|uniref:Uncharacterized protein n=1 Tax=Gibberella moniliformis (strain M3125 / FGSC 7600) TaxID=334819 RepID=W7NGZ0_GIBM7|nr:hypothetical protein FVEG_13664 [Fusarium verticillioides 7600]EWG55712.1 hypothetical protein FVEG_13664 [Fusarium verticillioides 7600]RBQ89684.1 hypothetical protein FVER53263_13664 [Fusarium verticillioides]